jgi:hypothetical protein
MNDLKITLAEKINSHYPVPSILLKQVSKEIWFYMYINTCLNNPTSLVKDEIFKYFYGLEVL